MGGGLLLGALLGMLYCAVVLQHMYAWILLLMGVVGASFVGARYGKRRLGQPLTTDQKIRLALKFTSTLACLVGPIAIGFPRLLGAGMRERLDTLNSAGVGGALAVAVLGVGAVALLHYLLLSLFTPANGRNGSTVKSHA
jgi:hypothetical protein